MNYLLRVITLVIIGLLASCENAKYSDGFSEKAFDSVALGDGMEKVLDLLGQPSRISEYTGGRTIFHDPAGFDVSAVPSSPVTDHIRFNYTEQIDKSKDYRLKCIYFNSDLRVTRKDEEMWKD